MVDDLIRLKKHSRAFNLERRGQKMKFLTCFIYVSSTLAAAGLLTRGGYLPALFFAIPMAVSGLFLARFRLKEIEREEKN